MTEAIEQNTSPTEWEGPAYEYGVTWGAESDAVRVEQVDREAAAALHIAYAKGFLDRMRAISAAKRIQAGEWDSLSTVQAFARHRLASQHRNAVPEGWQPIETAPRGGSLFDVWVPSYAEPGKGYRVADLHMDLQGTLFRRRDPLPVVLAHPPTHWMALPAAPALTNSTMEDRRG